jgi:hypothetical protein
MTNSYDDLIEKAYNGFLEIKRKSPDELKQWVASQPLFPPTIPAHEQGFHLISADGLEALHTLGRQWRQNNPRFHRVIGVVSVQHAAAAAFGDLIAMATDPPGSTEVKDAYLKMLEDRIRDETRREYFYFPAWVFDQSDVGTFEIGPVTFFRREDWLAKVEQVAGAAMPWKREVSDRWAGHEPRWCKWIVQAARRLLCVPPQRNIADDVVRTIGTCRWIITVAVEGQERERARQCASIAAVTALESLGLTLDRETHRSFRGPGHETQVRMHYGLSQFEGMSGFNSSTSIDLPHIGGRPGAQVAFLHDTRKLRAAVADALQAFVDVSPEGNVPLLKQRWVEAMYWFGQARREKNDFISLVKLGIALDILAKGGKAKGILRLCCAVLNKNEAEVVTSDGLQLGALVTKLYDDGRSQIAHGGRLALLRELPVALQLADGITSQILVGYVACLAKYHGPDEYEDFILAIPTILPSLK